jgi:hypothetical protein
LIERSLLRWSRPFDLAEGQLLIRTVHIYGRITAY